MSIPAVFGIYGISDIGKTTLVENLVSQLTKEGYMVATIKQTKKAISLDSTYKDTWRHHKAGAELVVFSSRCETDFLFSKTLSTSELIQKISRFGSYDIVLVEGANNSDIPKIQIGSGKKRNNTIVSYSGDLNKILTLMKRDINKKHSSQHLSIIVNGKKIPLTEFPKQIIANTIVGMLSSLKGIQDIHDVTIEMKR